MANFTSRDTIAVRRAGGGRSVTFVATDLIPGRPLRLWAVLAETGTAGCGQLIRLGILGANDGWSVTQLLAVTQARLAAEHARTGTATAGTMVRCLDRAISAHREALDDASNSPVVFEPGDAVSPYPWTIARCGRFSIALCPNAEGVGDGVTHEQLLVALDLALSAWLPVTPWRRRAWETRRAVREALTIETKGAAAAGA